MGLKWCPLQNCSCSFVSKEDVFKRHFWLLRMCLFLHKGLAFALAKYPVSLNKIVRVTAERPVLGFAFLSAYPVSGSAVDEPNGSAEAMLSVV